MCLYFSNNEYLIVYKLLKTNILFLLLFSTFSSERNNSSPSCRFKSRRSARKKFIFIHFHAFSHIFKHIHILPWSLTLFPHLYMYFLHYFYYCLILHQLSQLSQYFQLLSQIKLLVGQYSFLILIHQTTRRYRQINTD